MRCDDLQAVKASASRLVPEVLHELRVRVSCLVSRVSCVACWVEGEKRKKEMWK